MLGPTTQEGIMKPANQILPFVFDNDRELSELGAAWIVHNMLTGDNRDDAERLMYVFRLGALLAMLLNEDDRSSALIEKISRNIKDGKAACHTLGVLGDLEPRDYPRTIVKMRSYYLTDKEPPSSILSSQELFDALLAIASCVDELDEALLRG